MRDEINNLNYIIVASGQTRSFAITLGLKEGYEANAPTHTFSEVSEAIKEWITKRAEDGKSFLTGILKEGEVIYVVKDEFSGGEKVVTFSGEIDILKGAEINDTEAKAMLFDLAALLGGLTKQKQVYVSYNGSSWIIEQGSYGK